MSVAIPIPLLQHLPDVNVSLGVGVDEYALCWDNDTARFVLRAPAAPFAGILATGATVGATAQAQAFTLGVVSPFDAPAADSTTAWQVRKADKTTAVLNVDTTNQRVGIGTIAPGYTVHAQKTVAGVVSIATQNLDATGYAEFRATAPGAEFVFQILGSSFSTVGLLTPTTAYIGGNSAVANVIVGTEKSTGVLQFVIGGVMAANEKMRILSTGFVGIGAVSPATRLDIDAGALTMKEMTAPTGVADKAMLYTKDNGSGKTQLCCKLGDDVEIVLATQA
jgi:hypothetical protein